MQCKVTLLVGLVCWNQVVHVKDLGSRSWAGVMSYCEVVSMDVCLQQGQCRLHVLGSLR